MQPLPFGADFGQIRHRSGDVLLVVRFAEIAAQIGIRAQCLHQPLRGAEVKHLTHVAESQTAMIGIIAQQVGALRPRKVHIGIVEQRGEIVFREAKTQTLVIDQPSVLSTNEHVLALEIPMHQTARQAGQAAAELPERFMRGVVLGIGKITPQVAAHKVFQEVVLLPFVERLIKAGFEFLNIGRRQRLFSNGMKFGRFT